MNAQVKVGLTRAEQQRFSLARLLTAIAMPGSKYAAAGAFELEACAAVREALKLDTPGFPLTDELMLGRTLTSTGGVGTGGAVVETEVDDDYWGPALRAQSKVRALGATVLPPETPANTEAVPIITTGATVAALTENASRADADAAFALTTYSPHTIRGNTTVSRRLLVQTDRVEGIVRADLVQAIAEAEDLYALQGSGAAGQPQGIIGATGVNVSPLGANGTAPTWAMVIDCIRQVGVARAIRGPAMGWIASTKARCTMMNVQKTGSWGLLWDDADDEELEGDDNLGPSTMVTYDGAIAGYPAMATENVPSNLTKGTGTNLSALIFGNWADEYIVEFSPPVILADPYTFSNTGAVRFNVYKEIDALPRRPKSFCTVVDMIAA